MHRYIGKGLLITEFQAMMWTQPVCFLFPRSWAPSSAQQEDNVRLLSWMNLYLMQHLTAYFSLPPDIWANYYSERHLAHPNPHHNYSQNYYHGSAVASLKYAHAFLRKVRFCMCLQNESGHVRSPSWAEVLFISVCAGLSLKVATQSHGEGLKLNPALVSSASHPAKAPGFP